MFEDVISPKIKALASQNWLKIEIINLFDHLTFSKGPDLRAIYVLEISPHNTF